jgi:hypothetical protein
MNKDQLAEMSLRGRLRFYQWLGCSCQHESYLQEDKARQEDLEELTWLVTDLEAKKRAVPTCAGD